MPKNHLVFFVRDLLCELDLSSIEALIQAKDPRGERPYDPRLMLWILLYGYCLGIYSSRRLERATWEDVSFRVICGDCHPHFTTINEFRRVHRTAFKALFLGVLKLCDEAGMVSLGHVAIDGTKIKADASKHKAMSYARLDPEERRLLAEIEEMLDKSEALDSEEDERFGAGRQEFELPDDLKDPTVRLQRIREARLAIEERARTARAEQLRERASVQEARAEEEDDPIERSRQATRAGKARAQAEEIEGSGGDDDDDPPGALPTHRPVATKDGTPKPGAQYNFTDPDSRVMKGRDGGFIQAYNPQIVVDDAHQVIVAMGVTNKAPDNGNLAPMMQRVHQNLGRLPEVVTADSGYWNPEGVGKVEHVGCLALVATKRSRRTERAPPQTVESREPTTNPSPVENMRRRLEDPEYRAIYRRRKAVVEPVFGQIKEARGFRQFSFRGLANVDAEWSLICACHNLLKLFRMNKEPKPA